MKGTSAVAVGAAMLAIAFSLVAVGLIAAGGTAPVPDNWGFRGYWALMSLLFTLPGANLALRRPRHPIGWTLLLVGVLSALDGAMQEYVTYGAFLHPGSLPFTTPIAWILSWSFLFAIGPILFILLTFPDGHLPSPRWRSAVWMAIFTVTLSALTFAFRPGQLENAQAVTNPLGATGTLETIRHAFDQLVQILFVAVSAVAAWAPFSRFHGARGDERQQLKWFAYSGGLLAAAVLVLIATGTSKPGQVLVILAMGTIPVSVAIAVLRYRLYDIDILINRTIVYGATSALLAAVFVAIVLSLQALLRPVTSGSEVAVAASTMLTLAAFQPLRARVQDAVDRRFYRSRYDAVRTLDEFTARLRNDVDMEHLRRDLLEVVGETVRPVHAAVWLRR